MKNNESVKEKKAVLKQILQDESKVICIPNIQIEIWEVIKKTIKYTGREK